MKKLKTVSEKIMCAIYARVSTDRQGDSVENQVSQAKEYIRRLGDEYETNDELVFVDEAVSGYYTSVFDRAAMKKAISSAKQGNYRIIVFKEVSRVGRDKQENPAIIGMFEQYGVRVIAINDNYDSLNKDNITFDILSVLSEQESKKISVRVSSARKQKAGRGQWNGEPPFGYKVNPDTKKLEIHEEYSKIPKIAFDLYVNRGYGTFKVAEHLNNLGYLSKNGNRWSRETINRMLKNQAYIGQVAYGTRRNVLQREYDDTGKMSKKKVQIKIDKKEWQVVENAHPALIDPDMFFEAQKILLSKSHQRAPKRAYHPLTGILYCGKCGQGMVCQKRSNGDKEYRYYICKTYHKFGRDTCSQANVNADELEYEIVSAMRRKIAGRSFDGFNIKANRNQDINRLDGEMKSAQSRKAKLMKDQMDIFSQRDLFPEELYKQQMIDIKNRVSATDDEIEIIQNQLNGLLEKMSEESSFQNLIEGVKNLDLRDSEKARVLLHRAIKEIIIDGEIVDINYIYDFS